MESSTPHTRDVESTSSQFRSCGMKLIWPWVRAEAEATDLEHANRIVFIMKKSDWTDEIDQSCSIYRKQETGKGTCHLTSVFMHHRKFVQNCESLQANCPLYKQDNNMDSTNESEPYCPQHGLAALGRRLQRVKDDVDN